MEICRNYRHILFDLLIQYSKIRVRVMVFNAAFNNISVISWLSVVLVEENIDIQFIVQDTFLE
jgi:hypothetical protein